MFSRGMSSSYTCMFSCTRMVSSCTRSMMSSLPPTCVVVVGGVSRRGRDDVGWTLFDADDQCAAAALMRIPATAAEVAVACLRSIEAVTSASASATRRSADAIAASSASARRPARPPLVDGSSETMASCTIAMPSAARPPRMSAPEAHANHAASAASQHARPKSPTTACGEPPRRIAATVTEQSAATTAADTAAITAYRRAMADATDATDATA